MANPIKTAADAIPADKVDLRPAGSPATGYVTAADWNLIAAFADSVVTFLTGTPQYVAASGTISLSVPVTIWGSADTADRLALPDGSYHGQMKRVMVNTTDGGSPTGRITGKVNSASGTTYLSFDGAPAFGTYVDFVWMAPEPTAGGTYWIVLGATQNASGAASGNWSLH
jgi:hypothetical protein